jgi:UV DNA damage endonuclease
MQNLGYACINMTLGKKGITTNRSMIKRTFKEKGINHASELGIQNVRDLIEIIKWNEQNGIKLFRMSSDFFPWASEYKLSDMPHYQSYQKYT